MAIVIRDRVKETTTTTGTGTISMGGAVTGFRAFSSAFTTGDQTYYVIEGGSEWEVGKGTLTTGTPWTMSRDTILASSNSGSAVNFSAGTKYVYCDLPASIATNSRSFMGALVNKSADQTAANYSSATAVAWDAEQYDTSGFHDNATNNTRLTVPSGFGITKVRLHAQIGIPDGTATSGQTPTLFLAKNGDSTGPTFGYVGFAATKSQQGSTNQYLQIITPTIAVTDGDYFEAFFVSGGDTSVTISAESSFAIEVVEATTLG